jgi:hypothetical protein
MEKFNLWKETWLLNDSEWLKNRQEDWHQVENLLSERKNKNELASIKKYFMKGEWTPNTKYEPTHALKFILHPEPTVEVYEHILSTILKQKSIDYVREDIVYTLSRNNGASLLLGNASKTKTLIEHIIFNVCEFTDDTRTLYSQEVRDFPLAVDFKYDLNGFFWLYVRQVNKWLDTKNSNPYCPILYLLKHWFTAVAYLPEQKFKHKPNSEGLYNLFLKIHHYIPDYQTNSGALAKSGFVTLFNEYAAEFGFPVNEIQQLWNKAGDDKEDAWVDECYEYTQDEIDDWENYEGEVYRTLVFRSSDNFPELTRSIAEVYSGYSFTYSQFSEKNTDIIDLTAHLSTNFIAEFNSPDNSRILGCREKILLTSKFTGTDKVKITLDLITFIHSSDTEGEVPRFMIVERPDKPYNLVNSRIFNKNRQCMVDAIKDKVGIQLLRYFGYSHDPSTELTIPAPPEEYGLYVKEIESPFYDVPYFPLAIGTTPFLDKLENDYET